MANKPPKPYVSLACLCEKTLRETDGANSLIRVVDGFSVSLPPKPPEGFKPVLLAKLVVGLKSADLVGDYELTIRLHGPAGAKSPSTFPVTFAEGHSGGVTAHIDCALEVKNFGDCWFDVEWYGELLTRVPFTVTQAPASEDKQKRNQQPRADREGPQA